MRGSTLGPYITFSQSNQVLTISSSNGHKLDQRRSCGVPLCLPALLSQAVPKQKPHKRHNPLDLVGGVVDTSLSVNFSGSCVSFLNVGAASQFTVASLQPSRALPTACNAGDAMIAIQLIGGLLQVPLHAGSQRPWLRPGG